MESIGNLAGVSLTISIIFFLLLLVILRLLQSIFQTRVLQNGTIQVALRQDHVDSWKVSNEWNISSGKFVVLTVEDNGHGMDKETKTKIFEPYFTTKVRSEGTGLGLAVVHGIVKECNGFIELESAVGKGSRFLVYLPLSEQDLPKVSDQAISETLPTGYEHILLIDDEEALCAVGKLHLERLGYRVTALRSSQEALDIFRADPDSFDLAISDQTMPEITGSNLALAIFRLRPTMPFIICSGYTSTISEEEALSIGISRFIKKPVSRSSLANTVRAVLDERRTRYFFY
jgi:CheY-like chemotaxis protein